MTKLAPFQKALFASVDEIETQILFGLMFCIEHGSSYPKELLESGEAAKVLSKTSLEALTLVVKSMDDESPSLNNSRVSEKNEDEVVFSEKQLRSLVEGKMKKRKSGTIKIGTDVFPGMSKFKRRPAKIAKIASDDDAADEVQSGVGSSEQTSTENKHSDDSDERSEVSKILKARFEISIAPVVDKYNRFKHQNVEIVKTGSYVVGTYVVGSSPDGQVQVVHMNLEAKDKDDPDALVQTFFVELLVNANDIDITLFRLVGTSDMLPKEADAGNCLYCWHQGGIHHPKGYMHRCGREYLYPILLEKIQKFKTDNIGNENLDELSFDELASKCANLALRQYNEAQATTYELVETYGLGGAALISPGLIMHLNFEAKNKNGPPNAFFAEAININSGGILVTFCKCMGPTESLPDKADLWGCAYCVDTMYHPRGNGYLTGQENFNRK